MAEVTGYIRQRIGRSELRMDLFHVLEYLLRGEQDADAVDQGCGLLGAAAAQGLPQVGQMAVQSGLEAHQEAVRRVGVCIVPELLLRLPVQGPQELLRLAYGGQLGGQPLLPGIGQALPFVVVQEHVGKYDPRATAVQAAYQALYFGKSFVHGHLQT